MTFKYGGMPDETPVVPVYRKDKTSQERRFAGDEAFETVSKQLAGEIVNNEGYDVKLLNREHERVRAGAAQRIRELLDDPTANISDRMRSRLSGVCKFIDTLNSIGGFDKGAGPSPLMG